MHNPSWEKRLLDIAGAEDLELLRIIRENEQTRLSLELFTSPDYAAVIHLNELHDALIARALKLAEIEMARLGLGAPPVPYTYLLFGSGGRHEQTMCSDQDSGLIYANSSNELEAERSRHYFSVFAETVVQFLMTLGYPPCEGGVIASNPEWCLPLADWEKKIDGWFAEPSWENVRYLLIVADGRPLLGDWKLADKMRDRFYTDMLDNPIIARRMMENTVRHKVLVGVFGQLLTERYGKNTGSLDIKYGAYIPMVNAYRLLAIQSGTRETSTLRRIQALRLAGLLSIEEADQAVEAFTFFLKLRMLTTLSNNGKLSPEQLTRELKVPLKKALRSGKKLQQRVQRELQRRFGGR